MFADAIYPVAHAMSTNAPPTNLNTPGYGEPGEMTGLRIFCIARHGRAINVVFLDGHARRVPLEELWKLKWNNQWVPTVVTLPPE